MGKFNEIYLSGTPSYPRQAVARFAGAIENPSVKKEFIQRTRDLVKGATFARGLLFSATRSHEFWSNDPAKNAESSFCSGREIYEALKGGSDEVLEAGRPLYDGMSDFNYICMDFVRPEDYCKDRRPIYPEGDPLA